MIMVVCPTCRNAKQRVAQGTPYFPFCSRRCREKDLTAWANEEYRFPGPEFSSDDEKPEPSSFEDED